MKGHPLVFKMGGELAGYSAALRARPIAPGTHCPDYVARHSTSTSRRERAETPKSEHKSAAPKSKAWEKRNEQFANRDFFLSVLGSSATKRDARAYLKQFTPPKEDSSTPKLVVKKLDKDVQSSSQHGVNLGSFYGPVRAVQDSPRFVQPHRGPVTAPKSPVVKGLLHIALVKIRKPQDMAEVTINGIAKTLSQLAKLGLTSAVVIDCDQDPNSIRTNYSWKDVAHQQANRLAAAIDTHGGPGARMVDNVIGISDDSGAPNSLEVDVGQEIHVKFRTLLMTPLQRGVIPVIPAVGYTDSLQTAVALKADDVVLALTREFAVSHLGSTSVGSLDGTTKPKARESEVSVDRLIILDPLGGIPALHRPNGYHVFLNMEQEFPSVKEDLLRKPSEAQDSDLASHNSETPPVSNSGNSNPFSRFVETEFNLHPKSTSSTEPESRRDVSETNLTHLRNLELVRTVLSILPSNASALLTTPDEAANSGRESDASIQVTGVGTRRQRNPLIHNLLTDKPVFSSSLPAGRLGQSNLSPHEKDIALSTRISPTTFAKRGMSVTIFPDPSTHPWEPPRPGQPQLTLTDPRIDLARLVHLIDDSFDRQLDLEAYLKRVNERVAGVIIAGEYEGGALLTWELPPGVPDDGSAASRARMVPYLDKFAVLKRSQGAGGVADVVFKAMVRDCFPGGVCWRSRRDNPVNKWYFERSCGTWRMPGTHWTMFWTTPELGSRERTFKDYEGVCRSIEPTWADKKKVLG